MQNFIAQSMRRAGLAPANKGPVSSQSPTNKMNQTGTAPDSHMKIGSKWSYSTLEYPADIQERSDLGHYMMFYINQQQGAQLEFGQATGKNGQTSVMEDAKQRSIPKNIRQRNYLANITGITSIISNIAFAAASVESLRN